MDKAVAEAIENRKEDHKEFVTMLAGINAAVEFLGLAKNCVNKLHNPKIYKAPPKEGPQRARAHHIQDGWNLAPTAPSGCIEPVLRLRSCFARDVGCLYQEICREQRCLRHHRNADKAEPKKMMEDSADAEANLLKLNDETKSEMIENEEAMKTLKDLHLDCDWPFPNYKVRKEARAFHL